MHRCSNSSSLAEFGSHLKDRKKERNLCVAKREFSGSRTQTHADPAVRIITLPLGPGNRPRSLHAKNTLNRESNRRFKSCHAELTRNKACQADKAAATSEYLSLFISLPSRVGRTAAVETAARDLQRARRKGKKACKARRREPRAPRSGCAPLEQDSKSWLGPGPQGPQKHRALYMVQRC